MKNKIIFTLFLTFFIANAGLDNIICASSLSDTTFVEVKRKPGKIPQVGFACELGIGQLQALFNTPGLISDI